MGEHHLLVYWHSDLQWLSEIQKVVGDVAHVSNCPTAWGSWSLLNNIGGTNMPTCYTGFTRDGDPAPANNGQDVSLC